MTQGSTTHFSYDAFGQLTAIEDDLGRRYQLEYFDDPRPESEGGDGPRYGLLKKVKDWVEGAPRTVEYEYDTDRRLVKVKLPEVTTTAPEYGQYAFTGSSRPTVEYRYEPSTNVTSDESDTHAILHGDFAKLRLEGFEQPGSDVLRARFEYESTTGRVKTVAFPDANNVNAGGSGVEWKLEYPGEASTAAPATKATVKAPWDHSVEHTIEKGRDKEIKEANVEALGAGDATPGVGGAMPTKTLTASYTFDESGRLTKATRPDGSIAEYAYSSSGDLLAKGNVTSVTQKAGGAAKGPVGYTETVTAFSYGEDNLITQATDAEGRAISPGLAPAGGGTATSGYQAEGVLTTSTFDTFGRVTRSESAGTAPVISSMVFGQDKSGRANAGLLESITAGGFTETLRYDERDTVKEQTTSYGTSSTFTNDEWDRVVDETAGKSSGSLAPVNAKAQRAFDAAGRPVRERRYQTGIGWVERRYEYNARDQIKSVTQTDLAGPAPGGGLVEGTTTYAYDSFGRVTSMTSPAGILTTTSYDSTGRPTSTQIGASGARRRGYDELGRMVFTSDGDQGSWRGRFDAWGRMYEEQSAASALIERQHDRAGGLVRETAKDGPAILEQTSFTPTSFGGVKRAEQLVAGGGSPSTSVVTANDYDGTGRIIATRRSAGGEGETLQQQVAYELGTGRELSITSPAGITSYHYASGTPWVDSITVTETTATEHPPIAVTASLTHDALGRVVLEERAGAVTQRRLDEAGNALILVTPGAGTTSSRFDSRGLVVAASLPSIGRDVAYGFDADGRLLATSVLRESGTREMTSYAYDRSGRMSAWTRPGSPTESFSYFPDDTLQTWTTRLANSAGQQLVVSHAYDPSNRLTFRGPANPEAFAGASRPQGLTALDGGDVMSYDGLGRLTSAGILPQSGAPGSEPRSLVTYSGFDTRGLPQHERVGMWPQGAALERRYDAFGNARVTLLPQSIAGSGSFAGFAGSFDTLDRLEHVSQAAADGSPVPGSLFGATLGWAGAGRPLGVTTAGGLASSLAYTPATGRLERLEVAAGGAALGGAAYRWDSGRDLKTAREADPGLLDTMGWSSGYDAAGRMTSAVAELATWQYGYGKADELVSIHDSSEDAFTYTSGPEGRIETRTGPEGTATFHYDGEGRRIEDDRFAYTWDWRGRLLGVDVKSGEHAGERIAFGYDATGRLQTRTHLGVMPQGGTDAERPFIAKRAFTWDGQRLAAEAGLNFEDRVIWRQQYAPGPQGVDDAPLVHVERDLLGSPSEGTYALVRDEMGSVLALLEQRADGSTPRLLERSLYAPYGSRHAETGPELLDIRFDPGVVKAGDIEQHTTEGVSQPGALVVRTTLAIDEASTENGVLVERWDAGAAGWMSVDRDEYAIGAPGLAQGQVGQTSGEGSEIAVMRRDGWANGERYRVTLTAAVKDEHDRGLQLPTVEQAGIAALLDVPADGTTSPAYARHFDLHYGTSEVDPTFRGVLPGGMGSAFQGAWTDPLSNLAYHRARWFNPHDGLWLGPDPELSVDSLNLYAFVGLQPPTRSDPLGESVLGQVGKPLTRAGGKVLVRKTLIRKLRQELRRRALERLYHVHHLVGRELGRTYALWFAEIGFKVEARRNLMLLPTRLGRELVAKGASRALHSGRHLGAYVQRVESRIIQIRQFHSAGMLSAEQALRAVEVLQAELRQGLKTGEIVLQSADVAHFTAWAAGVLGVVLISEEELRAEEAAQLDAAVEAYLERERQKNTYVKYLTLTHYTGGGGFLGFVGKAVDFFNPVQDVIDVTDLLEDAYDWAASEF